MAKVATISSSDLGSRCWWPIRAVGPCSSCARYDVCKIPERVAHPEYDEARQKARKLALASEEMYRKANAIRDGKNG